MRNLTWVDYSKACCMFLVYVNHTEIYYGYNIPYAEVIYKPFFVNLFFIISGYLLFRKYLSVPHVNMRYEEWNICVKKSYLPNLFYKLAIPTILFSFINYFPKKIIRGETIGLKSFVFETLGGGSLWFTSAMVISQFVICIMLYKRSSIWFYFVISILLAAFANILANYDINICKSSSFPWFYKSGMVAVLFMTIGGLYWKYEDRISTLINKHKFLLMFLFILYCGIMLNNNVVKCSTINADVNILGIIATCLSSMLLINLFKRCKQIDIVTFIGRNSICFYFLSGSIPNILALITKRVFPDANILIVIILAIISFIVAWVVVKLLMHYMPFLFDLRILRK